MRNALLEKYSFDVKIGIMLEYEFSDRDKLIRILWCRQSLRRSSLILASEIFWMKSLLLPGGNTFKLTWYKAYTVCQFIFKAAIYLVFIASIWINGGPVAICQPSQSRGVSSIDFGATRNRSFLHGLVFRVSLLLLLWDAEIILINLRVVSDSWWSLSSPRSGGEYFRRSVL